MEPVLSALKGNVQAISLMPANLYLHIVCAILLTALLAWAITWIYRKTYRGTGYSQSLIQTIIMMSVVVAIVMTVIGNNLAVAFGLVGAFSIIRFRSAIGDPKDIAYIFFGMAAGVAVGLGYYLAAVLFTTLLLGIVVVLYKFNYGARDSGCTLRVTVPENTRLDNLFDDFFQDCLSFWELQSIETINLGTLVEMRYRIRLKQDRSHQDLIDSVRSRNSNLKVALSFIE